MNHDSSAESTPRYPIPPWLHGALAGTVMLIGVMCALKRAAAYNSFFFLIGYSITMMLPFQLVYLLILSPLYAGLVPHEQKSPLLPVCMTLSALICLQILALPVLPVIWLPYRRRRVEGSFSRRRTGVLLAAAAGALAAALLLPPWGFLREARQQLFPQPTTTKTRTMEIYEQFLEDLETVHVDKVSVRKFVNMHTIHYTPEFSIPAQIVEILRQAPAKYYPHRRGVPQPGGEYTFMIQMFDVDTTAYFAYEYDHFNDKGKTHVRIITGPNNQPAYVLIDNVYLDQMVALMEGYETDYITFGEWKQALVDASPGSVTVRVEAGGDTWEYRPDQQTLVVMKDALSGGYGKNIYYSPEEALPDGNVYVYISMPGYDVTIVHNHSNYGESAVYDRDILQHSPLVRIQTEEKLVFYYTGSSYIDKILDALQGNAQTEEGADEQLSE